MKKYIMIAIVFLLFIFNVVSSEAVLISQESTSAIKKIAEHSTVHIFSIGNSMGTCTGILIENTNAYSVSLTAKHCVDVFEEVYVDDSLASYITVSANDDLAVVIADPVTSKIPAKLAKIRSRKSDLVCHLGYPSTGDVFSCGQVTRVSKDWQFANFYTIPGCSGGGVFNKYGELTGVMWGYVEYSFIDKKGSAIFEPLQDVLEFLNTIKQRYNQ